MSVQKMQSATRPNAFVLSASSVQASAVANSRPAEERKKCADALVPANFKRALARKTSPAAQSSASASAQAKTGPSLGSAKAQSQTQALDYSLFSQSTRKH